jgi:capsular polysaccharide biosynthesis protein
MTGDLPISLGVDELTVLPEKSSVDQLLTSETSCRVELLPTLSLPASVIAKGSIGPVAGSPRAEWWSPDPVIAMRAVNLFRILGAYYFPEFGVVVDREGRAMHSSMAEASYVTPDLLMLPHMRKELNEIMFSPPRSLNSLHNAAITMPWGGMPNYGHFVIDCLSSVASLAKIGAARTYTLVFPPLKVWHRDHLHLLGASPIELPKKCYYVEDAIFTDCMDSFLRAPNWNLRLVPEMQRSALQCRAGGARKIYLSRRDNAKRKFLSETQLETILSSRGFDIVQPEKLSVRDQLALFSETAVVVGCTGAAFANVLFCPPEAVVVEIQPRTMHEQWVRNICVMMGLRWAPYYCDSGEPDDPVVYGGQIRPSVGITFDFDLGEFLTHLDNVARVEVPG